MQNLTSLSQHLVESKMAEAIEVQPIRKEVALQAIKIIDQTCVEYGGHRIAITPQAF